MNAAPVPTAVVVPVLRSVSWWPLVGAGTLGLAVAALVDATAADGPVSTFGLLVAAAVVSAAATTAADPAEDLLDPLPFASRLRRGVRQALPMLVALALGLAALGITGAQAAGGLVALAVVAVCLTQAVPEGWVRLAAGVPLVWVALDLLVGPRLDGLGAWRAHPGAVVVVAVTLALLAYAGRNRTRPGAAGGSR